MLSQVNIRNLDGRARTLSSTPFNRPLNKDHHSQRLLSVETFGTWGLISLVFERETHIYALTLDFQVYRLVPSQERIDSAAEANLVKLVVQDCRKRERGEINIVKEQLLTSTGHRAVALSNFIQRVRNYSRALVPHI